MRTLILILSLINVLETNPRTKEVTNNSTETITAIFDAYEGELYFFTNVKDNKALTVIAENEDLVKDLGLKQGEHIGETFKILIEDDSENLVLKDIAKLP